MFDSIFNSTGASGIGLQEFMICIISALLMGLVVSIAYTIKNEYSKSFVVTLALLPTVVSAVIMLVNGNLGAGVAVAGAFSLVRFRSVPGTAKEITSIFLAMTVGLAFGMGYIGFGVLFTLILSSVNVLLNILPFGEKKIDTRKKILKITIPEELDYTDVFDDLFEKYLIKAELENVKTTNMGSMFKLTYNIMFKDSAQEKLFIDDIRCRNGNLEVMVLKQQTALYEL